MLHPTFIQPRYDEGGFAHLPGFIMRQFAKKRYDQIVFFFIDGFGWRFFETFQQHPLVHKMVQCGSVRQITSQFPSTTAAHVTCLHTAQAVGQHGIWEWNIYDPEVDAVITPLLYSLAGDKERDTLKTAGMDPSRILPQTTLHQSLVALGVTPHVFQHREYTPSTYSNAIFRGAQAHAYNTISEAMVNMRQTLAAAQTPTFCLLYYDKIDAICHTYGPNSEQVEAEIEAALDMIENRFDKTFAPDKRTLFLLTADHGQIATDPQTTLYLNTHPRFAGLEAFLQRNRAGQILPFGGSSRDLFLYIPQDRLDDAHYFLSTRLQGIADVVKTADLIAQGYFGPEISSKFLASVGSLVVLPYADQSVFWYEKDRFEYKFRGNHGGLTPEEMLVPLVTIEMG